MTQIVLLSELYLHDFKNEKLNKMGKKELIQIIQKSEEEKKELSERLITLQNNNKTIFLKEEKYLDELLKQTDNIVKKLKIANNLNVQEQIKEIEKFDQIIEMMKSNVYKCHANYIL